MRDVVTAVLGGGQGSRLWPLTRDRAKPAVPVGGKFRLIDIPISNSLHAGIGKIYVITQFNSESLHRHIAQTYRFDAFNNGFVNILAAEQTVSNRDWYQGTADAVRRNLQHLLDPAPRDVLILSGDQLYLMDLGAMVRQHRRRKADLTMAVKPVPREEAGAFGIMRLDDEGRIVEFVEKPQQREAVDPLVIARELQEAMGVEGDGEWVLASMGIYAFRTGRLRELLQGTTGDDFGHQVLPEALGRYDVQAYAHDGYWRDIGTIPSFHEANLDLARPRPPLDLYSPDRPIYTHPRFLPGTRVMGCQVEQSILCEGSILATSTIRESIIGIRAVVREGSTIERSVVMGATFFENDEEGDPGLGVGRGCEISNAILDLNARIGDGARLINERGVEEADEEHYTIRGGIIVVSRGAVIPPGTVI